MKKNLCLAIFSILVIFAQQGHAGYRLMGGVNLSSINLDVGTDSEKTDNTTGFHVSLISDKPLFSFLSFQSGTTFTSKGGENSKLLDCKSITLYYLQSPIMLSFKFPINESMALRAGGGIYLSFGLFGTMEDDFGKEDSFGNFNYFDAGWTFNGGIEFYSFYAGVIYENGLANISNMTLAGRKINATNSVLGFTLGIVF
jgi:hypothetical protein